jgi:hypothetical protein
MDYLGILLAAQLLEIHEALEQLGEWTAPNIHAAVSGVAEAHDLSLGALAQPIRISMCGGPYHVHRRYSRHSEQGGIARPIG